MAVGLLRQRRDALNGHALETAAAFWHLVDLLWLVLFVLALRGLGAARTGAYFSTAPFLGAAIAIVLLGESVSLLFWLAAAFMLFGVWLHLTERHEHMHQHQPLQHTHRHTHDEHHQHEHAEDVPPGAAHSHGHVHSPVRHSHPHFPDIHHRHRH